MDDKFDKINPQLADLYSISHKETSSIGKGATSNKNVIIYKENLEYKGKFWAKWRNLHRFGEKKWTQMWFASLRVFPGMSASLTR